MSEELKNPSEIFGSEDKYEKEHENDVRIGAIDKDSVSILKVLDDGGMVAILSGQEIMYVFIRFNQYQCFIHELNGEEGRYKAWDINERNRAMLSNLDSAADQLFEIRYKPEMDYMGVMVAAERGIVRFLDYIGALPVEDTDFMAWQDKEGE